MNKITIAILAVIFLGFAGLITWSLYNRDSIDWDNYDYAHFVEASDSNGNIADHYRGNLDSPITIVEWADFSCAFCATAHPMFQRIANDYSDRIVWILRHFPLGTFPNSITASSFVEAASLQGYFWEATEVVFANQNLWSGASESARRDIFVDILTRAIPTIDIDEVLANINSREIARKIDFDRQLGVRAGVQGTPSLLINGEHIPNSVSSDEAAFRSFINEALIAHGLEPGVISESD